MLVPFRSKKGFFWKLATALCLKNGHNRWCRMAPTNQFGQARDPAYRSLHVKRYQSHAELFGCRSGAFGFRAGLVCKTPDVFFARCGRRRTRRNPNQPMLDNKTYNSGAFFCGFDNRKGLRVQFWCVKGWNVEVVPNWIRIRGVVL